LSVSTAIVRERVPLADFIALEVAGNSLTARQTLKCHPKIYFGVQEVADVLDRPLPQCSVVHDLTVRTHVLLGDVPGWLVPRPKRHARALFVDEPGRSLPLRLYCQRVRLTLEWMFENFERLPGAPVAAKLVLRTASNEILPPAMLL
jgi:hypothetical protein